MLPIQGFKSAVGIGREITWGDEVARTAWFPLLSESMKISMPKRPKGTLAESGGSRNRRKHYIESKDVTGSIELLLTVEGFGLFLESLLGTSGTTGPTSGNYTHTYSLTGPLPSFTMEMLRGDGFSEVYTGCKIVKGSFKVETGKLVRFSADIIAKDSGGLVALEEATYTASRDATLEGADCGGVDWSGNTYVGKSLEIMVDNKLAPRKLLGSRLTAEPAPSDHQDITIKLDLEWETDALNTALAADTSADLTVGVTYGSLLVQFNLGNAYVEDVSNSISGVGVIGQSVTMRAEAVDGGNEGIEVVVVNTQASATEA